MDTIALIQEDFHVKMPIFKIKEKSKDLSLRITSKNKSKQTKIVIRLLFFFKIKIRKLDKTLSGQGDVKENSLDHHGTF